MNSYQRYCKRENPIGIERTYFSKGQTACHQNNYEKQDEVVSKTINQKKKTNNNNANKN